MQPSCFNLSAIFNPVETGFVVLSGELLHLGSVLCVCIQKGPKPQQRQLANRGSCGNCRGHHYCSVGMDEVSERF